MPGRRSDPRCECRSGSQRRPGSQQERRTSSQPLADWAREADQQAHADFRGMAAECWGCAMGVPRVPPDRRTDPLGTGRKVIGETIHQLAADVRDEVNPARWRVVVEGTARPAVEPGELKGPLAEELLHGGAPTGVLITGRLRHGLSLNPPRRYDARDHRLFHRYMAAFERAHGAHSKASRVGARFLRRGSEAGHKVCNLQVPGKIETFLEP
jgi:hypothetical protein